MSGQSWQGGQTGIDSDLVKSTLRRSGAEGWWGGQRARVGSLGLRAGAGGRARMAGEVGSCCAWQQQQQAGRQAGEQPPGPPTAAAPPTHTLMERALLLRGRGPRLLS